MNDLWAQLKKRIRRNASQDIATLFGAVNEGYARGRLATMPKVAIVILIGEENTEVVAAGDTSRQQLLEASWALQKQAQEWYPYGCAEDIEERERHEAEYAAQFPFECRFEGCHQRFKTDRGRKIHERTCIFKGATPFADGCGYVFANQKG